MQARLALVAALFLITPNISLSQEKIVPKRVLNASSLGSRGRFLSGTASVIIGEDSSGEEVVAVTLSRSGRKPLKVNFRDKESEDYFLAHVRSGSEVRIRLSQANSSTASFKKGRDAQTDIQILKSTQPPLISGSLNVLVLVASVNYTTTYPVCTKDEIDDEIFGRTHQYSVRNYFEEASSGRFSIRGDTFGPYPIRLSASASVLDPGVFADVASQLKQAAQRAGVNLSNYAHFLYVIDSRGAAGSGSNEAIVNCQRMSTTGTARHGTMNYVVPHEMGHNFGMDHAHTIDAAGVIGQANDASTIMATGMGFYTLPPNEHVTYNHYNAPNKLSLNWFDSSQVISAASGQFTIAPVELNTSLLPDRPRIIKLPKGNNRFFYVSFRQGIGTIGSNIGNMPAYANKISVHDWSGSFGDSTYLRKTLAVGENFTDASSGITITYTGWSGNEANISITSSCIPAAPLVGLDIGTILTSKNTTYPNPIGVLVRNVSSAGCPNMNISLTCGNVSGLSCAFTSGSIQNLAPGQTAATSLNVSIGELSSAEYTLPVLAAEGGVQGSTNLRVIVDATAPTVPQGLRVALGRGGRQIKLSWLPSSDALVGVYRYKIYRDGVYFAQVDNTKNSYVDSSVQSATSYSYNVSAVDGVGNESARSAPGSITTR